MSKDKKPPIKTLETKGFQPRPAKAGGVQGGHQPEKGSNPPPPPPNKDSGGKN